MRAGPRARPGFNIRDALALVDAAIPDYSVRRHAMGEGPQPGHG